MIRGSGTGQVVNRFKRRVVLVFLKQRLARGKNKAGMVSIEYCTAYLKKIKLRREQMGI